MRARGLGHRLHHPEAVYNEQSGRWIIALGRWDRFSPCLLAGLQPAALRDYWPVPSPKALCFRILDGAGPRYLAGAYGASNHRQIALGSSHRGRREPIVALPRAA